MALFLKKVLSIFLAFCATIAGYINATPEIPAGNPEEAFHVQFGSLSCQCYDYYLPENLSGVKNIVFMVHGGSWSTGTEKQFTSNAVAAAKSGFIAATMDYRKIQNGANAYDMVNDVQSAVSSLKKQLDSKKIKYGKMAMAGWSSGAHLTLLYSYEYYFKNSPIPIAFICVCAPPTDFLYDAHLSKTLMGEMAFSLMTSLSGEVILPGTENSHMNAIKSISPIYMVKKGVPPTIIVNGDDDDVVPPQNSEELYKRLKNAGVDCVHIVYKGAGHFLGSRFSGEAERAKAFYNFANKYF